MTVGITRATVRRMQGACGLACNEEGKPRAALGHSRFARSSVAHKVSRSCVRGERKSYRVAPLVAPVRVVHHYVRRRREARTGECTTGLVRGAATQAVRRGSDEGSGESRTGACVPTRDRPMEFRPGQQCACPGLLSTASTVGDKPSPISDGSDVWCAFGRNFACQICPTAFSRLEGHGHTDARSRPNLRNAIAARHGTPPRCRRSSTI